MPSAPGQQLHMACITIGTCCASNRGKAHQAVQLSDPQRQPSNLSRCLSRHSGIPGVVRSLSRYLINPGLSSSNNCAVDLAFLPLLGAAPRRVRLRDEKGHMPLACTLALDIYKQSPTSRPIHNPEEALNCSKRTVCSVFGRRDSASKIARRHQACKRKIPVRVAVKDTWSTLINFTTQ